MKMQPAFTRLPLVERQAIDGLARAEGRTRSEELRSLIQEGLRARHDQPYERDRIVTGTTDAAI
jgi:hypothetical protein